MKLLMQILLNQAKVATHHQFFLYQRNKRGIRVFRIQKSFYIITNYESSGSKQIKKITYKYRGLFKIMKKISDVNYKVELILNGKLNTNGHTLTKNKTIHR